LLVARAARREDERDRLGVEAPRHEREDHLGHTVQPLHVVDHADQRLVSRRLGEQPEHGQPHHQRLRRRARAQPECRRERLPLRLRQLAEVPEQRRDQLLQRRVRDLGLRLDTGGPGHPPGASVAREVVQQRGLPRAGLPAQHQHTALTSTDVTQQTVERIPLTPPPPQFRTLSGHGLEVTR
jgi:hypothetical protein